MKDGTPTYRDENGDESLLEVFPGWRNEWEGMPEFVQERLREYAVITIRFRNQRDLDEFAKLIGQRLNRNSQCTWYPELKKNELQPRVKYIDEP